MAIHKNKKIQMLQKAKTWPEKIFFSVFRYSLIFGICFIIILPILFMLSTMIKSRQDIISSFVIWLPMHFNVGTIMDNIADSFKILEYPKAFIGTIEYLVCTTVFQVISSCVIAYGFARYKFKGNKTLFTLVIGSFIIPPFTTLISTYLNFQRFDLFGIFKLTTGSPVNMLDSYLPFILMNATGFGYRSGLFIFIMRQFYSKMPRELEEAASIDGCGAFKIFYRIIIPLTGSAMITIGLFSLVWQWTDVFYSTIFVPNKTLLMKTILTFESKFMNSWQTTRNIFRIPRDPADLTLLTQTSILLVILPILVVYLVMQNFFIESIEKTGIVE